MRTTLSPKRPPVAVLALWVFAVIGMISGFALIYSARHGNLGRAPGEIQWYRDQKAKHLVAEGFTPEEAQRHAFVFDYIYTLADDAEFTKQRFMLAYVSLSASVLLGLSSSIILAFRNENQGA